MSSNPYILFRPTRSANAPKTSCPTTVPPEVATWRVHVVSNPFSLRFDRESGMRAFKKHAYLNGCIGIRRHSTFAVRPIHYAEHSGEKTNGKDIIGIGEKTNTGDDTGAYMVPRYR